MAVIWTRTEYGFQITAGETEGGECMIATLLEEDIGEQLFTLYEGLITGSSATLTANNSELDAELSLQQLSGSSMTVTLESCTPKQQGSDLRQRR